MNQFLCLLDPQPVSQVRPQSAYSVVCIPAGGPLPFQKKVWVRRSIKWRVRGKKKFCNLIVQFIFFSPEVITPNFFIEGCLVEVEALPGMLTVSVLKFFGAIISLLHSYCYVDQFFVFSRCIFVGEFEFYRFFSPITTLQ